MTAAASITVPAEMDSLMQSLDFVRSFTAENGFDKGRTGEIELCLEEILVNISSYAYPAGGGDIGLSCRLKSDGTLIVEVTDQGVPFDPLSVPDPDTSADVDNRNIGGLGIYFVKQLMDDVQYRREHERNILTLTIKPGPKVPERNPGTVA